MTLGAIREALADSTRLRVVEALTEGPATAKELADRLGVDPTNRIYYHLRILQRVGLAQVVGADLDGERALRRYGLGEAMGVFGNELVEGAGPDERAAFFAASLEAAGVEVRNLVLAAGESEPEMFLLRSVVWTTPEGFARLRDGIHALYEEASREASKPGVRYYRLTAAGYRADAGKGEE